MRPRYGSGTNTNHLNWLLPLGAEWTMRQRGSGPTRSYCLTTPYSAISTAFQIALHKVAIWSSTPG